MSFVSKPETNWLIKIQIEFVQSNLLPKRRLIREKLIQFALATIQLCAAKCWLGYSIGFVFPNKEEEAGLKFFKV